MDGAAWPQARAPLWQESIADFRVFCDSMTCLDFHKVYFSARRKIFPTFVLGMTSIKTTVLGTL